MESLFVIARPAPSGNGVHHVRLSRVPAVLQDSPGLAQRRVARSSALHPQIYHDGYLVHDNFVTESGLRALTSNFEQSRFLEGHRGQFLRNLVGELVAVEVGMRRVQESGFKCTDGSTSPEPGWENWWEIGGESGLYDQEGRYRVASLVISCAGWTMKNCGGGFCVYPRSHWLVADWLKANFESISLASLPKAIDVPAAPVRELNLGCGDAVLLHPLSTWCLAPNVSKCSTSFLFLNLYVKWPQEQQYSGTKAVQMWSCWTAPSSQLTEGFGAFQAEEVELVEEELKAIRGGWANVSYQESMPELPFSCSYVAPHDRLTWQLKSCVREFMLKEQWEEATVLLQRLAGLRPSLHEELSCNCLYCLTEGATSYVSQTGIRSIGPQEKLQAGRCCTLSAPDGQLAGRSGRKSILEDAERYLLRAIEMAPGWPLAYAELAQVLVLLGRGREKDILEVIQSMERKCNIDRLCSWYPEAYGDLKQCQERCQRLLSGQTFESD